MHVKVTGQQFAWRFEYPKADGGKAVTSTQLYVPEGRSIRYLVPRAVE